MFFGSWHGLWRALVVGVIAYVLLCCCCAFQANAPLSKMNVFDMVLTVLLGSTLTSVVVSKNVAQAGRLLPC